MTSGLSRRDKDRDRQVEPLFSALDDEGTSARASGWRRGLVWVLIVLALIAALVLWRIH